MILLTTSEIVALDEGFAMLPAGVIERREGLQAIRAKVDRAETDRARNLAMVARSTEPRPKEPA